MNAGNVAAFACGRAHPQVPGVTCLRQRYHAGDHRAEADGHLKTWTDPAWSAPGGIVTHPRRAGKTLAQLERFERVTPLDVVNRTAPRWLVPFLAGWTAALVTVGLDRWLT